MYKHNPPVSPLASLSTGQLEQQFITPAQAAEFVFRAAGFQLGNQAGKFKTMEQVEYAFDSQMMSYPQFVKAYATLVAVKSGVTDYREQFAVIPSVHNALERQINDQSWFWNMIDTVMVDDYRGVSIGIQIGSRVTNRTNTTVSDRPATVVGVDSDRHWEAQPWQHDIQLPWVTQIVQKHAGDWKKEMLDAYLEQIVDDRLQVCFNGTSRAIGTITDTTNLLDMDKGWIQLVKEYDSTRVIDETIPQSNKTTIGPDGDFETFDLLAAGMKASLDKRERNKRNSDLRLFVGENIIASYAGVYWGKHGDTPDQKELVMKAMSAAAGMPVIETPNLAADTVLLTWAKNLAFLIVSGTAQRSFELNHKRSAWNQWYENWATPWVHKPDGVMVYNNVSFV